MKRVFGFELDPNSGGTVIGEGKVVKPLAVGWQDEDHLMLWAEVRNPNPALRPNPGGIHVVAVLTGGEVPPVGYEYLGSAIQGGPTSILGGRSIVVHVYWGFLR